ncbi:DUF3817 domain-containing protein [Halalkalibacterium halodurans]|jgi:integral membrane protein|uniref:BH3318 protein n=2 Tax=Halalkalibacterium halodurans TaxID=86665 RepID=Q9K7P3_HALH5|nr:DUF3817 domain-containing protein [Halalkalibacterium halodurans]MDY7223851.1 DUF3817 domain-containing protein [Halalkalibacterium halodurans]MDY7243072.1 DUF3817 domain-containing protein [Halalkalibacterium halodurans]MED3647124.1 DUF3817 domain-containing protein [Halalkalibacterium halodurans]MED4083111.1 DUF3817 domain-containing protein [Halalkalibacterium halodurans]MED4086987.1 DUF3817 domain-containing protein [Halalkalibacterium halodurans]
MFSSSVQRFRLIGYAEGISFILLLGIAMPLKYMFDIPLAVTIVGAIHGVLFIIYVLAIMFMHGSNQWWKISHSLLALLASVLPFGPFILDKKILKAHDDSTYSA